MATRGSSPRRYVPGDVLLATFAQPREIFTTGSIGKSRCGKKAVDEPEENEILSIAEEEAYLRNEQLRAEMTRLADENGDLRPHLRERHRGRHS